MTVLAADSLSVSADSGKCILRGVSLELHAGEIIGLVGGNGAGKSTLLRALCGVTSVEGGQVMLNGKALAAYPHRERGKHVAFIAQATPVAWPLRVFDAVALGRLPHGIAAYSLPMRDGAIVEEAMRQCHIAYLRDRSINTLSGGEQARVWMARALATETGILLADEPTAGLDMHYQLLFMELLQYWRTEGRSAIVAIHDLSLAMRFCDRLIVLSHGQCVGSGNPAELMNSGVLSRAFGVELHTLMLDGVPTVVAHRRIPDDCMEGA